MKTNWVGWMLSGIVLLLLFLVAAILKNPVFLLLAGERSQGIVVGMATSSASLSKTDAAGVLQSPIVEFVTSTGERVRVSGRSYSTSPTLSVGDAVTVAYDPTQPRAAQFLLWSEFPLGIAGFILGFAGFVLLLWMCGVLISKDPALADPFGLLPAVIAHFRLNPLRFPLLFMLSVGSIAGAPLTYMYSKPALDLQFNGITAIGHVTGSRTTRSSSNRSVTAPEIAFKDASGMAYEILGSASGGSLSSPLEIDTVVEVIYLASNPGKGRLNVWSELWLAPLLGGSMTLGFFVALCLVLSGRVLSGTVGSSTTDPRRWIELKTSGVPAVATVIEANSEARILHYRIDKDPRKPSADLDDFETVEQTHDDWKPTQAEARTPPPPLKRGEQFRAYLDPLNPSDKFYVDFSDRIGSNPRVQSLQEEEAAIEQEEEYLVSKLRSLATTSAAYLSPESLSEIETLIEEDGLPLAFEKLVTAIMNLPRPLPTPLKNVNWDDYLELGGKLGLDEAMADDAEMGYDPKFWTKFSAFKQAHRSSTTG